MLRKPLTRFVKTQSSSFRYNNAIFNCWMKREKKKILSPILKYNFSFASIVSIRRTKEKRVKFLYIYLCNNEKMGEEISNSTSVKLFVPVAGFVQFFLDLKNSIFMLTPLLLGHKKKKERKTRVRRRLISVSVGLAQDINHERKGRGLNHLQSTEVRKNI